MPGQDCDNSQVHTLFSLPGTLPSQEESRSYCKRPSGHTSTRVADDVETMSSSTTHPSMPESRSYCKSPSGHRATPSIDDVETMSSSTTHSSIPKFRSYCKSPSCHYRRTVHDDVETSACRNGQRSRSSVQHVLPKLKSAMCGAFAEVNRKCFH